MFRYEEQVLSRWPEIFVGCLGFVLIVAGVVTWRCCVARRRRRAREAQQAAAAIRGGRNVRLSSCFCAAGELAVMSEDDVDLCPRIGT